MKNIVFLTMLLTITSCASYNGVKTNKISDEYKSFVGKKYYLMLDQKPVYSRAGDQYNVTNGAIKRCEKVSIIDIMAIGDSQTPSTVILKQGKNLYERDIISFSQFSKKLGIKNRKVKLKSGTHNSKKLLCNGNIWTGMNEAEFYFVMGPADKVNTTTRPGYIRKQLVYRKGDYKANYYYIRNGVLTSWQETN